MAGYPLIKGWWAGKRNLDETASYRLWSASTTDKTTKTLTSKLVSVSSHIISHVITLIVWWLALFSRWIRMPVRLPNRKPTSDWPSRKMFSHRKQVSAPEKFRELDSDQIKGGEFEFWCLETRFERNKKLRFWRSIFDSETKIWNSVSI